MVMGKKGATINEIRTKSGAAVKLLSPERGVPVVPMAEVDDELIVVRACCGWGPVLGLLCRKWVC
jgi:hypothetical protein